MPTIDESKTGSLTIYKYDLTNAEKDGVWDSSYVSTGVYDEAGVNNVLGGSTSSTLGNGETGYGYAITGVEFTYAKVADIFQYGETETTDGHVEILYAVDKAKGADFLKALGLADGKNRYEKADAVVGICRIIGYRLRRLSPVCPGIGIGCADLRPFFRPDCQFHHREEHHGALCCCQWCGHENI